MISFNETTIKGYHGGDFFLRNKSNIVIKFVRTRAADNRIHEDGFSENREYTLRKNR